MSDYISSSPARLSSKEFLKRLAWLVACVVIGALIGFVGSALSGNQIWYTAIPAVMAIGWLFFADPSQCESAACRGTERHQNIRNIP